MILIKFVRYSLCLVRKKWSVLKTKVNPGSLHGHSSTKVMGSMIIFGGKKGGQISNDLWKFYFGNISYYVQTGYILQKT